MARITPPTQQDIGELKDYEPYLATILKIDWDKSSPEYGGEDRMVIDWKLDGHELSVRDWIGLRLGRQQSGQVSKLRKILNAVGHKPEATDIAWFDDETLEWSYDGTKPYARLSEGATAILRGQNVEKQTDNGPKRRFSIIGYQPATDEPQAAKPAAVRGRPQTVKATPTDSEEPPF